ncbi:hypothetical protein HY484_03190, partial [Candidatus Woesearchaeota archaeon]|nr:hypothetical protein [Candidatus Woesearchaeota archaeon]
MQQTQNIQPNIQSQTQNTRPEKKFRAGALSISIWKNTTQKDGKAVEYHSVSLGRSYKKNGAWQNSTASLRVHDLPKLSLMIDEAYKYLIMNNVSEQTGGE